MEGGDRKSRDTQTLTHFVNAPQEKDPTVQFDPMREQKKAKEWKPLAPKVG